MRIGVRQRFFALLFFGLLSMALAGAYRYHSEREEILAASRSQGEQTGRLMAELAAPLLLTSDYAALHTMAQAFLHGADAREVLIIDSSGRELVRAAQPDRSGTAIPVGPFPIISSQARVGELRIAVYPNDIAARLKTFSLRTAAEEALLFLVLAVIFFFVSRAETSPLPDLVSVVRDVVDRKDLTRRADCRKGGGHGELAAGLNRLIEGLEQSANHRSVTASRIGELRHGIAAAIDEIHRNADAEAQNMTGVMTAVGKMTSSVQSVAESAQSLSLSAEETSSAILEMTSSNQEVARHAAELMSSVEEVTTSVMEMIATIREVAQHVETVSTAAEETAASAVQIETAVRDVEQAARESSRLSSQVSAEAHEIGLQAIQQTTEAMNRIRESVRSYSDLVTRLGKRSEEIGKILGVIVEVTERTNLLALNASILAARAGEHGRGFAVVAGEIKSLADRTAGSAHDIAGLISAVQKETREAVAAINESLAAVDEGVSRSEASGSALQKIMASSARSAETADRIERVTTEQARGIRHVSEAVANVKQMMHQIAMATHAQDQGTEMILNASEAMRDIARQVNNAMREQDRGGRQIAAAAENVAQRAAGIAASAREQGEVSREIASAVQRVQNLPRESRQRIEDLARTVKDLEDRISSADTTIVNATVRAAAQPEKLPAPGA